MTWIEVARDAASAAKLCFRNGHFRSAVSRSYYAMYAAVTGRLVQSGAEPPAGRPGWSHAKTQHLAIEVLRSRLGAKATREIRRMMAAAYSDRITADYLPGRTVDSAVAGRCVSYAIAVLRRLGVKG